MKDAFDLITMGRVGIDLYPLQHGVGLADVGCFAKSLGGSPTNVAVAAARLGLRSAVITRTGRDPFGGFVRKALRSFGVDDSFVTSVEGSPTPVVFCEVHPPDDFPLYFYRTPDAPDLQIKASDLDVQEIRRASAFWITLTGLSRQPSRDAHLAALQARGRARYTILDLDHRPSLWGSDDEAREMALTALPYVDVIVGNLHECQLAVGGTGPDEVAERLLDAGIDLAIVKCGPLGVVARSSSEPRQHKIPPVPVQVVNGLGAGDAFGGAFVHGLLSGDELDVCLLYASAAGSYVAGQLACADAMPTHAQIRAHLAAADRTLDGDPAVAHTPPVESAPTAPWRTAPKFVGPVHTAALIHTRVTSPSLIAEVAATRPRPTRPLGADGRVLLVAADHPARGALAAGSEPLAMANRPMLLDRLVRALSRPGVDGVLATADILDDLLLLGALDDKVVIASMNRGGIAGSVFELDDRLTGSGPRSIAARNYQGGKLLLRIDPADHSSVRTLELAARAIDSLAELGLATVVEPFLMSRDSRGRLQHELSTAEVIRSAAIAAGLGGTSAYTWLKLPVIEDMAPVLSATSQPVLLLGGDVRADQEQQRAAWKRAFEHPQVRGLIVGRNLLYPPDGDVAAAVDAAVELL